MTLHISCTCHCGGTVVKSMNLTEYVAGGSGTIRLGCNKCGSVMFVTIRNDTPE